MFWGTTRNIPDCCFVLEVIEPGLLVIKHRRIKGFGKFINVAVLKGDEIKIIDEHSKSLPDCPAMLTSLLDYNSPTGWNDSVNVLVQLAASMRQHGHGGTLLVVPSGSNVWRDSIIHPITYPVAPAFDELKTLMGQVVNERSMNLWQDDVNRAVDSVAGLTAVDGATVINDQLALLAFGAKIGVSSNGTPVEETLVTEPVVGSVAAVIHPSQMGGTRPPLGSPVCVRSARRHCPGFITGWPVHHILVVALRKYCTCPFCGFVAAVRALR